MQDIILMPYPREVIYGEGCFEIPEDAVIGCANISCPQTFYALSYLKRSIAEFARKNALIKDCACGAAVVFEKDMSLDLQGYRLNIKPDGISVAYGGSAGALHACATLKQLLFQCADRLPCVYINDYPDLLYRGIQLDISRNRIPTMKTLRHLIDLAVDIKANMFNLYVEGYPIDFPSFPEVRKPGNQLTLEDIRNVDKYCIERGVEFTANINSYAHNEAWLTLPEFNMYAEKPDGYDDENGDHHYSRMMALTTKESVDFIDRIYSDILPAYSSPYFVVGGDETEEIGHGKSREMVEKVGKGKTYVYCLNQIYNLCKKHSKTMMYWGDIILNYPELVDDMPNDAIAMEWGYDESYNFDVNSAVFKKAGKKFFVCPGTSAWNSIVGCRTDNMLINCSNAAKCGIKHGAMGYLVTGWGDCGYWEHMPDCYAGYVYGSAVAWGYENNKGEEGDMGAATARYISRFIYMDETEEAAAMHMSLGNYYKKMAIGCGNATHIDIVAHMNYKSNSIFTNAWTYTTAEADAVSVLAEEFLLKLKDIKFRGEYAETLMTEFRNGAELLRIAAKFASYRHRIFDGEKLEALRGEFEALKKDFELMQNEFKVAWLARNLYGNLDLSLSQMRNMKEFLSQ